MLFFGSSDEEISRIVETFPYLAACLPRMINSFEMTERALVVEGLGIALPHFYMALFHSVRYSDEQSITSKRITREIRL